MNASELNRLVAGLLLMTSCSVTAGTIVCEGEVEVLGYHATDKMMIKLSSMNVPVHFCSPDREWSVSGTSYKTGPKTCQTLYSTFLAAKISGKTIYNVWFDGDEVPTSCDAWDSWANTNIRHFKL
ncbi:hypothetical protein ABC502_02985 [Alkalimonas sp. NCh-2]|uniref:hypothetical protein n=1 Tax=Alkalimonas sp. NCh-2 TaxID=3144846 RepID=UPI0031F687C8